MGKGTCHSTWEIMLVSKTHTMDRKNSFLKLVTSDAAGQQILSLLIQWPIFLHWGDTVLYYADNQLCDSCPITHWAYPPDCGILFISKSELLFTFLPTSFYMWVIRAVEVAAFGSLWPLLFLLYLSWSPKVLLISINNI